MFLMKPKFTIYKSSFYIYTICQIYTVNIAKELHASEGGGGGGGGGGRYFGPHMG